MAILDIVFDTPKSIHDRTAVASGSYKILVWRWNTNLFVFRPVRVIVSNS